MQGYTLNQNRFDKNADELKQVLKLIEKAAQSPELTQEQGRGLLPSEQEARAALDELKANLISRGEATELFARARGDGLASILGNLDQTVFGEPSIPQYRK